MGCLPTDFPGYQKVANPDVIHKFQTAWSVELNTRPGLTSTEVFPAAIKGSIKGLYIFGEDPIVTDPDTGHIEKALKSLDFLVVQELFMTETAAYADVVLLKRKAPSPTRSAVSSGSARLLNQRGWQGMTYRYSATLWAGWDIPAIMTAQPRSWMR